RFFEEVLDYINNPDDAEAIDEVKADCIKDLVKGANGIVISDAQWKRLLDIQTKIYTDYTKQKIKSYNALVKTDKDIKDGKYAGTEWLIFPEDEKDLKNITGNVYYLTQKKEYNKLKHLHYTKHLFDSLLGNYKYKGTINELDENGNVTKVNKNYTVVICFDRENTITEHEIYNSMGLSYEQMKDKVNDRTHDFVRKRVTGFTFNENYKNPEDPVILKYPDDVEYIRNASSQAQMQAYYTKLNTEIRGINDYENSARKVAEQAKKLLRKLNTFEKPAKDGPNSDEFKAMHYELENLSKLGKNMKIGGGAYSSFSTTTDKISYNYVYTNLTRLSDAAAEYEKKHSSLSTKGYGWDRYEFSKQLQAFADSAKRKLNYRLYPGCKDVGSTDSWKKEINTKMKKLEHFRNKLGYKPFFGTQRTAPEVTKKLNDSLTAVNEATQKVHFGSKAYDDAAASLKTALNDYKMFMEGYEKGGPSISQVKLKESLVKAKTNIEAYLKYKKDQGEIKEGYVSDKKTQKRIDAMQMSLKSIDLAYSELDAVLDSMNKAKNNELRNFYKEAGVNINDDAPKAVQPYNLENARISAQIRLKDTEENDVKEAVCDIITVNFLRPRQAAGNVITEKDYKEARETIRNDPKLDTLFRSKPEKDIIKAASRDKGQDILNDFMTTKFKKSSPVTHTNNSNNKKLIKENKFKK
ncbi:MAG: hypothetical protein IJ645_02675, partial [Ruminococcus sp.]|nr:hypothetical protein [Ruminococcus sp.]